MRKASTSLQTSSASSKVQGDFPMANRRGRDITRCMDKAKNIPVYVTWWEVGKNGGVVGGAER